MKQIFQNDFLKKTHFTPCNSSSGFVEYISINSKDTTIAFKYMIKLFLNKLIR